MQNGEKTPRFSMGWAHWMYPQENINNWAKSLDFSEKRSIISECSGRGALKTAPIFYRHIEIRMIADREIPIIQVSKHISDRLETFLKNFRKVLDKKCWNVYYRWVVAWDDVRKPVRPALGTNSKSSQNFLKNFKKVLDRERWVVYTNEAVAESDGGTLKTS